MQGSLFGDDPETLLIKPAAVDPRINELAKTLSPNIYLGTSSWSYPGWNKLLWNGNYTEAQLARYGLTAYARHPLFRTVCIDRGFYKPLNVAQYAEYASQVSADFRFMVKAPRSITDSYVRNDRGAITGDNPLFLDPATTLQTFIQPMAEGLGSKLGVVVFQLSPLMALKLRDMSLLISRLHRLISAVMNSDVLPPQTIVAVEVRNPEWLNTEFINALKDTGAAYCLGLHHDMPGVEEQLRIVRGLWPGPFICRWNLSPGGPNYEEAAVRYGPFDRIQSPEPAIHDQLIPVIRATAKGGQTVFLAMSNNAEGCAPLSVIELARRLSQ